MVDGWKNLFLPEVFDMETQSLYIFSFCLAYLYFLINREVEEGQWRGLRLPRRLLTLTHLFFADDLILFGEAAKENCETIAKVLSDFCLHSGKKVNLEKSRVIFSSNLPEAARDRAAPIVGIGKYLGFHMELESIQSASLRAHHRQDLGKTCGLEIQLIIYCRVIDPHKLGLNINSGA